MPNPTDPAQRSETRTWYDVVGEGWATCGFGTYELASQYQQTCRAPSRIEKVTTTETWSRHPIPETEAAMSDKDGL